MASWTALRLNMERIDSPETSVTKFQTTLPNILEIEDPIYFCTSTEASNNAYIKYVYKFT